MGTPEFCDDRAVSLGHLRLDVVTNVVKRSKHKFVPLTDLEAVVLSVYSRPPSSKISAGMLANHATSMLFELQKGDATTQDDMYPSISRGELMTIVSRLIQNKLATWKG